MKAYELRSMSIKLSRLTVITQLLLLFLTADLEVISMNLLLMA